jgi:hypothetical protein
VRKQRVIKRDGQTEGRERHTHIVRERNTQTVRERHTYIQREREAKAQTGSEKDGVKE